jgi:hypothetical protein
MAAAPAQEAASSLPAAPGCVVVVTGRVPVLCTPAVGVLVALELPARARPQI